MKPGPLQACKVLPEVINITSGPRPAIDWLTEICFHKGWYANLSEACEAAERWQARFLTRLQSELSELNKLGRVSLYAFNSSSDYMLQGAAFIEPRDPPDIKAAKAKRARFNDYVSALGELKPLEFEALCVGVLEELGVQGLQLTPRSADEGIDFYGRLHLEGYLLPIDKYPTIQKQLSVWIVGQAKHYRSGRVSTFEIRDLVGAVSLARGRAYGSKSPKYADLNINVCDPVFYLFFTTGQISANSWRLLGRSGVIGMDGEMLAAFLADRGIGVPAKVFSRESFADWVKKYE